MKLCAVGSTALWAVVQEHVLGEVPDLSQNSAWHDTVLCPGSDTQKEMSYQQQYDNLKLMLEKLNVRCAAVTHAMRGSSARNSVNQG